MAKWAKGGFGSDGRGLGTTPDGYDFLVNDSVRTGDVFYPAVHQWKSGKIFGTTGKVLSTARENSVEGRKIKQNLENGGAKGDKPIEPQYAMTTKEAGAKAARAEQGGKFVSGGTDKVTAQGLQTRQANVKQLAGQGAKQPNETFDAYSARFVPKGKGER